jgi:Skp family chaperone for outer membrane proteins
MFGTAGHLPAQLHSQRRREMRFFTQPNRLWSHWLILSATASLAVFVWEGFSDEPPASGVRQHEIPIAFVDIAEVFKKFRDFNAEMNRIKVEIGEFEREVRASQSDIKRLADEGSSEGSGKSAEELEKLSADLAAKIGAKRQEFLADESRVYFDAYERVAKVVERLAAERDIGVVFRQSREPMKRDDRESVLKGVNRAVIHSTVPDLTDDVLADLNQ